MPPRLAALSLALLALAACTPPPEPPAPTPVAAAPAPAPALPPIQPFDAAVRRAATIVLGTSLPGSSASGTARSIVIDPLVDGVTGDQSVATRQIGERIAALARSDYPQYRVEPFTAASLAEQPLVMVGTFTPVNGANQPAGERIAYRFCLVLADLRSGRTVAKGVARAAPEEVDPTPAGPFRDSPAWTDDPAIRSYVNTCQATRVGDAIPDDYLRAIGTAALVQEAAELLEAGRYPQALAGYEAARATAAGDQLRVHNGLYLANHRLHRAAAAEAAFGDLAGYGLQHGRLAVKLLFRAGSTGFLPGPDAGGQYPMWLRQIAGRAADRGSCVEVRGHTSTSGPAAVNERLSVARAEAVRALMLVNAPALGAQVIATGVGSREALVGTGADDATDILDRRVEFRVLPGCG